MADTTSTPDIKQLFFDECAKESGLTVIIDNHQNHRDACGIDYTITAKLRIDGDGGENIFEQRNARYDYDDPELNKILSVETTEFKERYTKHLKVEDNTSNSFTVSNDKPKIEPPTHLSFRQVTKILSVLGIKNPGNVAEKIAYKETSNPDVNPEMHKYDTQSLPNRLTSYGITKPFVYAAVRAVVSYK